MNFLENFLQFLFAICFASAFLDFAQWMSTNSELNDYDDTE